MYNVYNASEVIYLKDLRNGSIRLIGNEKDLIHFLAKEFQRSKTNHINDKWGNNYLNKFVCLEKDYCYNGPYYYNHYEELYDYADKYYLFFDGVGRHINPMLYRKTAWELYNKKYKNVKEKTWWDFPMTPGKDFRNGLPIKGIHKRKYHRPRMPRYKQRLLIQTTKEYKEFNRGDKEYFWDDGWWCGNHRS